MTVVITNQPVIARGDVTLEGLKKIHAKLDYELGLDNAYIDKLYVCPHHPHKGFPGEVEEFKVKCNCRKPETGLIDRAIHELQINSKTSWFIGDSTSDILAGKNARLNTVLVKTGHGGRDAKYSVKPDFIFPDLSAAIDYILNDFK